GSPFRSDCSQREYSASGRGDRSWALDRRWRTERPGRSTTLVLECGPAPRPPRRSDRRSLKAHARRRARGGRRHLSIAIVGVEDQRPIRVLRTRVVADARGDVVGVPGRILAAGNVGSDGGPGHGAPPAGSRREKEGGGQALGGGGGGVGGGVGGGCRGRGSVERGVCADE